MGIEVIARDWDRPDWCGTLYPADLPEDWRLTYFANAFEAVLVPAAVWHGAAPSRLTGWAEDVPQRFRFYLELGPGDDPRGLARMAAPLGGKFAGLVADRPWPDGPPGSDRPYPSPNSNPDPAPAQTLPAWDAEGKTLLARQIPRAMVTDPRAAVAWLTSLAAEAGSRPALAILGEAPADALAHWSQLVLLAGLA